MDGKRGLAAILRDARKGALLRMRSEIYFTTSFAGATGKGGRWRNKTLLSAFIVDDSPIGPHDHIFSRTAQEIHPRHRRPAGPSRLRAGVVHLSGQPFREPRARQYFDGCPCHRRLLPHRVLAISPGRDGVLYCRPGPRRSWDLGALRAPAIPLEGHRTAAARARLEHPGAHHRPHCRRAARPCSFRAPKALSAGALWLPDRVAVQDTDDVRGPGDLMGSRLHRPLFLAADESVL